jgi:sulfhydrogenase subunit beta (sulfur reductase)
MQTLRLEASRLSELTRHLMAWGSVWAPVEDASSGAFRLEILEDPEAARPDALRTVIPFKKLLLPPSFAMMKGGFAGPAMADNGPENNDRRPQVFFGAHACDVHALKILDLLYLSDIRDPYYAVNRDALLVVGFGCWPDDKCFCDSLGTSNVDDGFDLALTPLDGRFLVTVATSKGDDLVTACRDLFAPATPDDLHEYLARLRERRKAFQLHLDVSDLPYVLEMKKGDPVWDELARKCLCCGSCSMVCPTCSCFNVADRIEEDGTASRVRTWDSCLYRDYAAVAGGHNFRADRGDRVRTRYYHKQEAFVREFGMPSCVGCGRCIENCPTGIHVVEVFQHVRGDL